jgi:Xaa-Pro aminopeptidase
MAIEKGPQVFPREDYLRRLARVKSEMAKRDIDTLVVTHDRNMNYLTGYYAPTGYVPQGLVVLAHEEEPTLILRLMDGPLGHYQSYLRRESVLPYPEHLVGTSEKDGYDFIIDFIKQKGSDKRGVGLEFGYLPPAGIEKFKSCLPPSKVVNCTGMVTWLRLVKTDLEVGLMREAAAITDAAFKKASEVIRSGVREADAAAEIIATLVRGVNGKPSSKVQNYWMNSSPRTGASHAQWTEDVFHTGQHVNLEVAGSRRSYCAPMSRVFSVGKPSDQLRKLHDAQLAGLNAALGMIRPGKTCDDVARTIAAELKKHGVKKESRCGYPIGIDWLEPTCSLMIGDMTVLEPNMCFHLHLGNWVNEDFGVMVSQSIAVSKDGVEVLTKFPQKMIETAA